MRRFELRAVQGEFHVFVAHDGVPPVGEALRLAERFSSELRFGVESNDRAVLDLAQKLACAVDGEQIRPRCFDASLGFRSFAAELAARIERELRLGRIRVELRHTPSLTERPRLILEDVPPLPPPRPAPGTHHFEVRLVDEIGQAITGVDLDFELGEDSTTVATNAAGLASVDDVAATSGSVTAEGEALDKATESRWEKLRRGTPPKGGNTTTLTFDGEGLGPIQLKPEVPNTIVLRPPLGSLFVELWDRTGRVRHARKSYSIRGPQELSGVTDESGRLLHPEVFPGDYELTLTVDDDGQEATTQVVVQSATAGEPQLRFLGAVPVVALARLRGTVFETNKSFLLPASVAELARIGDVYANVEPAELLVVGHTDTTGEPDINDPLSLERAKSTAAYLADDVDAWLDCYGSSVPALRRWGAHEDRLMLEALPDFGSKPIGEDSARWFQRTRGLTVDGKLGPETRRQLITEYMDVDGTSLKEPREFDINVTVHGCGENFPLADDDSELDPAPADETEDGTDRRVELFFFDREFGIQPPPPGDNSAAGSSEYPEWRDKATLLHELESEHSQGLVLEWLEELTAELPGDLVLEAKQGDTIEELAWEDGDTDGDFRRFLFEQILGNGPITLTAKSELAGGDLVLWDEQSVSDPDAPPVWQHVLEELVLARDDDGGLETGAVVPPSSDHELAPPAPGDFLGV